jgi:hypothetical protein
MSKIDLEGMTDTEFAELKTYVLFESERRAREQVEEAFQKIEYLGDEKLKMLINRIHQHFAEKDQKRGTKSVKVDRLLDQGQE